jgi:hypothetical protein
MTSAAWRQERGVWEETTKDEGPLRRTKSGRLWAGGLAERDEGALGGELDAVEGEVEGLAAKEG